MDRQSRQLDLWGAGISLACGLHCVGITAALVAMPALWLRGELLGLPLTWWRIAEFALAATAIAVALWALILGWRRHRHPAPAVLGAVGMVLICSGLGLPMASPLRASTLVLVGGLVLVGAHLLNRTWLLRPTVDGSA